MVIFLNADGSCQKVTPEHVYQGSNNVNDITVIAPYAQSTALLIGFVLPNGLYWESSDGSRYVPMDYVPQSVDGNVGAWHYNLRSSVTELMGDLYVAINAVTAQGNTTSYMCRVIIEESVLPNLPSEPEPDVYDLILKYLGRVQGSLVAVVEKVPGTSNAIRYIDNFGAISSPIVLFGDGESAPIPVNTASKITIPETAWQAEYSGTDIANYTYTIAAGMHGQMRDGAEPSDLWVSADTADGMDLLGYFPRYTVDTSGNITIKVNQPIAMNVRIWNGKSIVDTTARDLITTETANREAEDQKLQAQINELVSGNVDAVARAAVVAERERAEQAEQALQSNINAEANRAETAEGELQENINSEVNRATAAEESLRTAITDLETTVSELVTVVSFTADEWTDTASGLYYLGAVNKSVTVPEGKRIVQILDSNNTPRGTWRNNIIYANEAFAGVAIII